MENGKLSLKDTIQLQLNSLRSVITTWPGKLYIAEDVESLVSGLNERIDELETIIREKREALW